MNWRRCLLPLLVVTSTSLAFPEKRSYSYSDEDDTDSATSSSEESLFIGNKNILYDVAERPRNSTNDTEPVNVEVNLYLRDVEEIDNYRQDVKLHLTFRQQWYDNRLKFDGVEDDDYITLTNPNRIWTPDTFIANEREGKFHDLLKPNILIRVYPSGKVLYSAKLTVVIKCMMDFHDYPFDRQECFSVFASYGYTTKQVTYSWRPKVSVAVSKNPHSPPFELEQYYTDKCGPVQTKTGSYDCLRVSLIFKRNAMSILLKTYFPSALFVVLSWLSFWMAAKFVSARCMVLVTTLVSTTLVYFFMVDSLPPVNYTRSMDKWMWTCIAFIFAAVMEFLIVVSLSKKQEDSQNTKVEPFTIANNEEKEKKFVIVNLKDYISSRSPENWSVVLDKISRLIFPLSFTLFLIIYFVQVKQGFEGYEVSSRGYVP